ncbi:MAG: hypothetical protein M1823_001169 [Watsoniomyces obsoletus]|nr:MAG: hypothetical protein M1823_001169 [Watsoniomyces obsoletus]
MQSGYSSGPPAPYPGPAAAPHQHGGPASMQGPGPPMAPGSYYHLPGGPPPPSHAGQFAPGPPFPPSPSAAGLHRPWSTTGSLPTAPPASQFQASTYNPSIYGPMPGAQQSPVSPLKPTYQPSGASPGLPAVSGSDSPGGHPPTTGYPQAQHPQSRPPMHHIGPHGGPQQPMYGGPSDQQSYFGKPPLPDRPHPGGINTMSHQTDQQPDSTLSPARPRPYSMFPQAPNMQGPPFPPGPGSSAQYPPQGFNPSYPQQAYNVTAGPPQQYHGGPPMDEQRPQGQSYEMPPRPPPLPQGYQAELLRNHQAALQHPPYSHLPPTHRYDPTYQPQTSQPQYHHQGPPPGQTASHAPPPGTQGFGNVSAPPPPPPVPPKTPPGFHASGEANRPPMNYGPPPPSTAAPHPGSWSSGAPLPGHPGYVPAGPPQLSPPTHTASMTNPTWVPTPEPSIAGTPPPPSPHSSGGPSQPPAVATSQTSSTTPHQPAAMAVTDHHRQSSGEHPLRFPGAQPYQAPGMEQQQPGPRRPPPRVSSVQAQVSWTRPPPPPSRHEPRPEPARNYHGGQPNENRPPHMRSQSVAPGAQEQSTARPGSSGTHRFPQQPSGASAAQPPTQQMAFGGSQDQGNVPPSEGHIGPSSQPPSLNETAASGHAQRRPDEPSKQGDMNANSGRPPPPTRVSTEPLTNRQTFSGIGASVLGGIGGPSDWEHFGEPTDEDSDNGEGEMTPSVTTASQPTAVIAELDTGSPVRVSQPLPVETPTVDGPGLWRASTTPAPLNPHRRVSDVERPETELEPKPEAGTQDARPPFPPLSRISTSQTDGGFSSTGATPSEDPSGIIDQAIQAWAEPASDDIRKPDATDGPQLVHAVPPTETRDTTNEAPAVTRHDARMMSEQQSLAEGPDIPTVEHRRPSSGLSIRRDGTATPDTQSPEGYTELRQEQNSVASFADLDEQSHESLSRYATMLRKEAEASTHMEKLQTFRDFLLEECARRGFSLEETMGPEQSSNNNNNNNVIELEHSAAREGIPTVSGNNGAPQSLLTPKRVLTPIQLSSHLAVQDTEEEQYSPGGRPVLRPVHFQPNGNQGRRALQESPTEETATSSNADVPPINLPGVIEQPRPASPAANAPIPVDAGEMTFVSPPNHRPKSVVSNRASIAFGSPQQTLPGGQRSRADTLGTYKPYTPPAKTVSQNPNQRPMRVLSPPTVRSNSPTPSQQPRSLPQQAGLRVSVLSKTTLASPVPLAGPAQQAPDILKGTDANSPRVAEQAPLSSVSEGIIASSQPSALIQGLRKLLPTNREQHLPTNESLASIEHALRAVSDDLAFSDRLFAAWEEEAKKTREQVQLDRHRRQEEHHNFAERLFSESQINYADLTAMEEDFQRSEATKEAHETELQYHSYAQKVFDPVYTRLQEHIKDLMEQYVPLIDLMKSAAARQNSHEAPSELGRIIDVLLDLHARIELRHDQVLQAILERDRRYQRAMLQPLYAAGDAAKVREFEVHFDEAAQKTRLDAAVTTRQRAERLMQAIEPNVTKGAAEGIYVMRTIADEIRHISETLSTTTTATGEGVPVPDRAAIRYELKFAHEWLHTLAGTSEALMRQSHAAALGLQRARSEEVVLSTKMSPASGDEAFKKLRDEQAKEEERLMKDLEQRVRPIYEDLHQVLDQIDRVLARVGHVSTD